MARNQNQTDEDLTDVGEEKLHRDQLKNSTFKKRRCVARNGLCTTHPVCCDNNICVPVNPRYNPADWRCLSYDDVHRLNNFFKIALASAAALAAIMIAIGIIYFIFCVHGSYSAVSH